MLSRKAYNTLFYKQVALGFIYVLTLGLTGAFLPILALQYDPSEMLAGVVVSAWFFSRIFLEIPIGVLSDRIGRRTPLIIGLLISAAGSFLCASAPSIYHLIGGQTIWGFGTALVFLNNTALILDQAKPEMRDRVVGIFQSFQFMGSLFGAPIGALLSIYIGYQNVFYVAFAFVIISIMLALTLKDIKRAGQRREYSSNHSILSSLKTLRVREVVIICTGSLLRMFIEAGIIGTVLKLYLNQQLSFEVSLISIIVSARVLGFITGTFLSGYIIDKINQRNTVIAGFVLDGLAINLLTTTTLLEHIIVLMLLAGIGSGMVFSTLTVWLNRIVEPKNRGISIGLNRTMLDLGGLLGPIFFVIVYDMVNAQLVFIAGGFLLYIGVLLTTVIR